MESEQIGTVGVGEATVPHLKLFNQILAIDEIEFIRQVQGTFKLGIEFVDWARIGDRYIHGFGTIGHDHGLLPFYQYWLKLFLAGKTLDIGAYSLNTVAGPLGKFMASASDAPANSPLANIAYAYHFDAGRYAQYLRRYAETRGVRQVMLGQRIRPRSYHPVVDQMTDKDLGDFVDGVRRVIAGCVEAMPMHAQFIDRCCRADAPAK